MVPLLALLLLACAGLWVAIARAVVFDAADDDCDEESSHNEDDDDIEQGKRVGTIRHEANVGTQNDETCVDDGENT